MQALDELLVRWRTTPNRETTVELAARLGASGRTVLMRELGARAEKDLSGDVVAMLAVGNMFLKAGLLSEAQSTLVLAGKADPRAPEPFRALGEVLLRRGDAERARRVLKRAVDLGATDPSTRLWLDRTVAYVAIQKRVGMEGVAAEVARGLPLARGAQPPPPRRAGSPGLVVPASPALTDAAAAGVDDPTPLAVASVLPRLLAAAVPSATPRAAGLSAEPQPSSAADSSSLPPAEFWLYGGPPPAPSAAPQPEPVVEESPVPVGNPSASTIDHSANTIPMPQTAADPTPGTSTANPETAEAAPAKIPDAHLVLQHLARVGLYEPDQKANLRWEPPGRQRARGTWVMLVATLLILASGSGAYVFATRVQAARRETARVESEEIATLLASGGLTELQSTDGRLARVFELDSRSARGAKLWLQNRVMRSLWLREEARGIDSAEQRARKVGVPPEQVVYGKIASFLVEGDLAGAAGVVSEWDRRAAAEPMFQLVAGAALEVAGEPQAADRYRAARRLDPKLWAADWMLARVVLLEDGVDAGEPLVEEIVRKQGDRPATRALRALRWAIATERGKPAPPPAPWKDGDEGELPLPLRVVPHLVRAVQAIEMDERTHAVEEIRAGLEDVTTPAVATELGVLAFRAGDEALARKAALLALRFSGLYPRARVLAARVALLGGRLDEALRAVNKVSPKNLEAARLRAAVAYERMDSVLLARALETLAGDTSERELAAIRVAPAVLLGLTAPDLEKVQALAVPAVLWGEVVAVDVALDTGKIDLAGTLVRLWGSRAGGRPSFALREARLARHLGKLEDAARLSSQALDGSPPSARVVIERAFVLAALGQIDTLGRLVAAEGHAVESSPGYLDLFRTALTGHKSEALIKASKLGLPSEEAPLLLKVLAARALALSKDPRAGQYLAEQLRAHPDHPDLKLGAEELKKR